jgi:hypothetical protein
MIMNIPSSTYNITSLVVSSMHIQRQEIFLKQQPSKFLHTYKKSLRLYNQPNYIYNTSFNSSPNRNPNSDNEMGSTANIPSTQTHFDTHPTKL